MDPDANLIEQRQTTRAITALVDACADDGTFTPAQLLELSHLAARLADLVEALDGWITGGGFLPARWERGQQHAKRVGA